MSLALKRNENPHGFVSGQNQDIYPAILTAELPGSPDPEKLARICQNVLRMWAEVQRGPCLVPTRRNQYRDCLNNPWADI